MKLAIAKKLHNGDEVIDKKTGESVNVLSTYLLPFCPIVPIIVIEGIGVQKGYGEWMHTDVK